MEMLWRNNQNLTNQGVCENEVEIFNIAAQQSILEHKSGQRFTVLFLLIF